MIRSIALIAVFGLFASLAASLALGEGSTPPAKPIAGCLNQSLTDGFWTLQVTKVVLGAEPDVSVPAWGVTFTFGNVQKKAVTPNSVGVGTPQLILKDGTALDMSTDSGIKFSHALSFASLQPNASKSATYWFRTDDPTAKAVTFVFPVAANNSVYNTPFGYPVKDPAFSVDLTCDKSASKSQ